MPLIPHEPDVWPLETALTKQVPPLPPENAFDEHPDAAKLLAVPLKLAVGTLCVLMRKLPDKDLFADARART